MEVLRLQGHLIKKIFSEIFIQLQKEPHLHHIFPHNFASVGDSFSATNHQYKR